MSELKRLHSCGISCETVTALNGSRAYEITLPLYPFADDEPIRFYVWKENRGWVAFDEGLTLFSARGIGYSDEEFADAVRYTDEIKFDGSELTTEPCATMKQAVSIMAMVIDRLGMLI